MKWQEDKKKWATWKLKNIFENACGGGGGGELPYKSDAVTVGNFEKNP